LPSGTVTLLLGDVERSTLHWETDPEAMREAMAALNAFAAEGLTNPQIGEKLFISARTVSTHLSHVFAKLNVASRSELAAKYVNRMML
jgi:DNA-binding NarL/FixJ family response regulator